MPMKEDNFFFESKYFATKIIFEMQSNIVYISSNMKSLKIQKKYEQIENKIDKMKKL